MQELILLKDFEQRENNILSRCDLKERELDEIESKVQTSKIKLGLFD